MKYLFPLITVIQYVLIYIILPVIYSKKFKGFVPNGNAPH